MITAFSDPDAELHERRRRLCLGLLGLGLLAACGRKGDLEPPPGDEPSSDPFEEEDEERMKEEG